MIYDLIYGKPTPKRRRKKKGVTPAQRKRARMAAKRLAQLEAEKKALQEKAAIEKAIAAAKAREAKLKAEIAKLKGV